MYRVRDEKVWWEEDGVEKELGGVETPLVDIHQDLAPHAEVQRVLLPVGDYILVGPENHLIVVEEKRLPDLVTSWRARRLQRQLRRMLMANDGGVNVLGLRSATMLSLVDAYKYRQVPEISLDLLKWQSLGGLVGFLPFSPDGTLATLRDWRAVLRPGSHLFSILAGDDRNKPRESMSRVAKGLRALVPGVGYEVGRRWAEASGENLLTALQMTDEQLKEAGLNVRVRRALAQMLGDE